MEPSVAKRYKKGDLVKWSSKEDYCHANARDLINHPAGLARLLEDPFALGDNSESVLFKIKFSRCRFPLEYSCLWFEEPSKEDLVRYAAP